MINVCFLNSQNPSWMLPVDGIVKCNAPP